MTENPVYAAARSLGKAYGIFPVTIGGAYDKHPAPEVNSGEPSLHNQMRERLPTEPELHAWFGSGHRGIGLWCGQRGLACIDFDDPEAFEPWKASVVDHDGAELLTKVLLVRTRHGFHAWYRCPDKPAPTRKLARFAEPRYCPIRDKDIRTRIEIRGVGAYAIAPPTRGYEVLESGLISSISLEDLPALTIEEQELLLTCATLQDQAEPEPSEVSALAPPKPGAKKVRPGDWFNETADARQLLESAGGTYVRTSGGRELWRRPGKQRSWSATTGNGRSGQNLIRIHTDEWPPFEQRSYDLFSFYATLHHRGDLKAAAAAIAEMEGFPKDDRKPKAAAADPPEFDPDLPVIETRDRQLRDVTADAFAALLASNTPPTIFVRGGLLVKVDLDEEGRAAFAPLQERRLVSVLARCANWTARSKRDGLLQVDPPGSVVSDLMHLAPWTGIPPVKTLTICPVVAPDGSIRLEPGYHPSALSYVATSCSWEIRSGSGAEAAQWILDEVLCDFPFADQADRANALGLMILPFVRPCVTGPTPLHLIDAPAQGTGKSLLARVSLLPGIGNISSATAPKDEESWRKFITGALLKGAPAVFLDNVARKLSSESLSQVLTSTVWEDRLLGGNVLMSLPNMATWLATSNNARLDDDQVRRTVQIRLDAQVENPVDRSGFRHEDLLEWAAPRRMLIGGAILAMIAEWVRAGMPAGKQRLASYDSWARIVGGILASCEVPGFLGNVQRLRETSNEEDLLWRTFVALWFERFGDEQVTVKELYDGLSETEPLQELAGESTDPENRRKRLGKLLGYRVDRVYSHLRVSKGTRHQGSRRFKLEPTGAFRALESQNLTPRVRDHAHAHDAGAPATRTEANPASKASIGTNGLPFEPDPGGAFSSTGADSVPEVEL